MLYHAPDQARAVYQMYRVLRPGGTLAVTTNGRENLRELYALTTVFGSEPIDPSAAAFGFETAAELLEAQFGNVRREPYPAGLRVTSPEDVFLALTSYPPGDGAPPDQLAAFSARIAAAFETGGGALDVTGQTALFLSVKG
jgi:SAM-dependent methyltransferase